MPGHFAIGILAREGPGDAAAGGVAAFLPGSDLSREQQPRWTGA